MKLFELQKNLTSYKYPAIKIAVCLTVIALCIARNKVFRFSNPWIEAAVTIITLVLAAASILCFYISVGEMFEVFWKRKKKKHRPLKTKQFTIDEIMKIVAKNDIIEIDVYTNNGTITIGASSDCKKSDFVFFDKAYYIEDTEYKTLELFRTALVKLFPEGFVPVSKIDGLPVK